MLFFTPFLQTIPFSLLIPLTFEHAKLLFTTCISLVQIVFQTALIFNMFPTTKREQDIPLSLFCPSHPSSFANKVAVILCTVPVLSLFFHCTTSPSQSCTCPGGLGPALHPWLADGGFSGPLLYTPVIAAKRTGTVWHMGSLNPHRANRMLPCKVLRVTTNATINHRRHRSPALLNRDLPGPPQEMCVSKELGALSFSLDRGSSHSIKLNFIFLNLYFAL